MHTTSIVYEKTPSETAADLWEALQEGLIVPLGDAYKFLTGDLTQSEAESPDQSDFTVSYRFLHDRVQQSAYSLISDSPKSCDFGYKKIIHLILCF